MSKIRRGVVLVLLLLLLGTPVMASELAPSPTTLLADLWSAVLDIVELVFQQSEFGPTPDPGG